MFSGLFFVLFLTIHNIQFAFFITVKYGPDIFVKLSIIMPAFCS